MDVRDAPIVARDGDILSLSPPGGDVLGPGWSDRRDRDEGRGENNEQLFHQRVGKRIQERNVKGSTRVGWNVRSRLLLSPQTPLTVKLTGVKPFAVASTVYLPVAGPTVNTIVAWPFESVVLVVPRRIPPLEVHVTTRPGTAFPNWSRAWTTREI